MNDWVQIYSAMGEAEAIVIKSILEAEGIEARLVRESIGRIYNIAVDGLGEVKVFVRKEKEEEAKDILNNQDTGEGE